MKIGIEVHQRIDSHKLFCNCQSSGEEIKEEPDLRVLRKLHTVYSEMGEVDLASKREFEKDKTYEYLAYGKCNCLVETDEEPPHNMNRHALGIALEIAMHLKCKPVDEIHTMRKIIIDGSNTSGFQRTAIIALNGTLETSKGAVRIPQISIEEESAGIVETVGGKATFRLDRLGVPLIEITTEPDIKDEKHLSEVAEKIGMIMRATGKVARGLGTIRQDLNVSIEGGARVEIKGAQDLKMLPLLASGEVRRQTELLKIGAEVKAKGKAVDVKREFSNLTGVFTNTNAKLIKAGLAVGAKVVGMKLESHAGLIGKEIGTNRRYGTELSDYAKGAGVKGIIHSDEDMAKYGITAGEVDGIRKALGMKIEDAFVLVVGNENTARKALENVCMRAEMVGIPNETRKANPDGTTSYMRPLPGKARLYPETDIPPIIVDDKLMKSVEEGKGESLEAKKEKLLGMLNKEMADKMIKSRSLSLFEKLVAEFGPEVEPILIANTLENTLVSLRRDGFEITDIDSALTELFGTYSKGKFVKAAIPEILRLVAKGSSVENAIREGKLERIAGKELENIAKENNFDVPKIMQKYRLNVEPADIAAITNVTKTVKKHSK
ncbi:MAG: Glu-tRNA(Gln) amidotransferase subunit GatE [Candidatus Micrarchaeia archaeon]